MARKYLDDAGLSKLWLWDEDARKELQWGRQEKTFGFNESELWNLDATFFLWAYERVMYYLEFAPIDLMKFKFKFRSRRLTLNDLLERFAANAVAITNHPFNADGSVQTAGV